MNTRKNRINQVVVWPSTMFFAIERDLLVLNPKFKKITLRVRLANAIKEGKVSEIGTIPNPKGKGRPLKMFAMTPVTQNMLNKAKAEDITLVDNAEKLIHVISVNPSSTSSVVTISQTTSNPVITSTN